MRRLGRSKGFLLLMIVLVFAGCQRAGLQDVAQNSGEIAAEEVNPSGDTGLSAKAGTQAKAEQASSSETDGSLTGTDGDQVSEESSVEPRKEPVYIPVVIYELTDDILQLPVSSIPFYDKGKITFRSEEDIKASGNRSSGQLTGMDAVLALTSNLTGREDKELDWTAGADGERRTSEGLVMKETADRRFELFVPDIGRYEIELESPSGHEVLYVSKITWHPNRATGTGEQDRPDETRGARTIVFYELPEDVFKRPRTDIPYYANGVIKYQPEYVFVQHEEGHQPWLEVGFDVASVMTSNLTGQENPYLELKEMTPGFHFKQSTPSGIIIRRITDELTQLTVPDIGTYDIETTAPDPPKTMIKFVSKITLRLNEYS